MSSPQNQTTVTAVALPETRSDGATMLQFLATSRAPDVLQLRLIGELDFGNAGELTRAAHRHLHPDHRTLRLHLARLRFCDCAGLRAVVDLHDRMLHRRGALHLVEVSAPVRKVLRLTELDRALQLRAS